VPGYQVPPEVRREVPSRATNFSGMEKTGGKAEMRKITIIFRETDRHRKTDFNCVVCGKYKIAQGEVIEVRDCADNNQLLGLVCNACFTPSEWNGKVEKAVLAAEQRLFFLKSLKTDANDIRIFDEPLPGHEVPEERELIE
jgi:hypothetical protein